MALEHAGSHFNAVDDVTIYYEGMQNKKTGGRNTLPNLFSESWSEYIQFSGFLVKDQSKDIPPLLHLSNQITLLTMRKLF